MPSEILSHSEEYDLVVNQGQGLGQLFEAKARQSPDSVAVVDEKVSLTYQQLHLQALQISQKLFKGSLQIEEPVGIIVQHGWADVVAQMAIIYAGGSCAPMDPTLPDVQIKDRLEKLGARYILVDNANRSREVPFQQIHLEDCPIWTSKDAWTADKNLPVTTTLEHRTHLIHTSGTTSEPKAVQIVARSILQVVYHAPFEPVDSTDTVAHVNNTSFDVSLFDIWVPLLRGARIAVLSKVILLDLPAMAAAIKEKGITIMATTTALLNLAASTYPRAFSQLKICFIGGEAANVAAIETVMQQGPPQNLINAYGPTECCIFCLAHKITPEDVQAGTVSIGKPIGRTVAHICDETGAPVADGEEGELWIGGAGVSPGYVNRPEKNESMSVYLHSENKVQRFYRTGDRVKKRPDGQIDYVGRQDHQVKVRGYRIELEAVETAMIRTGQFSEAVALKVEAGGDAGSILVAFAVATSSKPQAMANAIEALRTALPDYMVPQIELISKMPLNSHAKVDRKHLSNLYRERWATSNTIKIKEINTGSTQQRLASLWVNILGLSSLPEDPYADFFQLGATSLQASLLISQIRKNLGADISLLTLYDHSGLADLASTIEKSQDRIAETVRNEKETWIQDTHIADDLIPPSKPVIDWRRDTEGRVFFTGGTGFVGAFLLADLLRTREVHQVGCLVRAADTAIGLERIKQAMGKYGQWEERFSDKLLILCGVLEDVYLGLGFERFHEIASWSSVIFHLGARVNYTQPYSLHRPANVIGTRNILRLACAGGRTKGVHYVSSISCFGPTGYVTKTNRILEDESLLKHVEALPYDHGYAQSQWVAEALLRRVMDRNFPIAIYRPGFITGHSQTGACNPDDFFSRLIHSCAEMGCYPLLPNQRKEFVPVDYVNATILHIASSPASSSLGHAYHIVPPSRNASIDMNAAMDLVSSASGTTIKGVPYQEWIDCLVEKSPARLQPLQPMLAEKAHEGLTRWELYENMPVYDTTNTAHMLNTLEGGLQFPILDRELMDKYVSYLSGF
ncbi:hypothetical protein N7532_007796 [Penicillium argentinense]|uniref:Carrier domain-containing protein n=1 Tax=Penicillium argentinense TaxID=1131581 RepID=A0A9W9EW51_9EURO|nr:uncharacterized protein N7532_007796 [Penicillium argentinense]KAJ5089112.1 hypothetical protein N7532_007796 [Penicillium argentinense]